MDGTRIPNQLKEIKMKNKPKQISRDKREKHSRTKYEKKISSKKDWNSTFKQRTAKWSKKKITPNKESWRIEDLCFESIDIQTV
jgi:hypothetical protein